jgi:hypothetical protein
MSARYVLHGRGLELLQRPAYGILALNPAVRGASQQQTLLGRAAEDVDPGLLEFGAGLGLTEL